ncbi:hypothetical protein SLS53_004218 [Cytospora paraplurivora]|uniref:Uncharacterized protein n=1 Tax=Cytospora paraplurivora TaxID=2898453 RepID=A0AAN9YFT2_9PEZI
MAALHDLPLEIRQEIWRLALLPEPGVPFMGEIDVFWADDPQHLVDFATKAGEFPPQDGRQAPRAVGEDFKELEDIAVVFGPTHARKARKVMRYDDASEGYSGGWAYDVPDIRLEDWTVGSTEESLAEVDGALARVRADFTSDLEKYEQGRKQWGAREGFEQEQEARYQGYTADDLVPRHQVAVQAKRMVKLGVLRGRSS